MKQVGAETVHFWAVTAALSCLTGTAFLACYRAGMFDQPLPDREVVVRMVTKVPEREPVEVWVNNPPDESECADVIEWHGPGRNPDLVIEVQTLRELPHVEELTFEEEMAAWRERDEDRRRLIDFRNRMRRPGNRTFYIPPEPSPEDIRLHQKRERDNEIQARITEEVAQREFELVEQREKEREDRRKRTIEETKRKVAFYRQFQERAEQ